MGGHPTLPRKALTAMRGIHTGVGHCHSLFGHYSLGFEYPNHQKRLVHRLNCRHSSLVTCDLPVLRGSQVRCVTCLPHGANLSSLFSCKTVTKEEPGTQLDTPGSSQFHAQPPYLDLVSVALLINKTATVCTCLEVSCPKQLVLLPQSNLPCLAPAL